MVFLGLLAPPLVVAPYLQLGPDDQTGVRKSLTLVWFGHPGSEVMYDAGAGKKRVRAQDDGARSTALLADLPPGRRFTYAISTRGTEWFRSDAVTPAGGSQSYRAVVIGDSGRGLPGQWALAKALGKEQLSLLVHTGDIVYPRGTEQEYLSYHFPVYNAEPGAARGIPLLRQVTSVATPGNHDTLFRSPSVVEGGGLAYYRFWDAPFTGDHRDQPDPAQRLREKERGNFSFAWGPSWWGG
ncbi:MAG: hypothetical protein C4320_08500, partial [Armatimonadota bacterium]